MQIMIEITPEDIQKGHQASMSSCPVALALRRTTGHIWHVVATEAWGVVGGVIYELPPEVSRFIRDFDNRQPVQPFTFALGL